MQWHSTSDPRIRGFGGRSFLDRACHGITGHTDDPKEMVRNGPNRRLRLEPPVPGRIENWSPLRMSLLVSAVSVLPSAIPLLRGPKWAGRHSAQRLLDTPHPPGRKPPVALE